MFLLFALSTIMDFLTLLSAVFYDSFSGMAVFAMLRLEWHLSTEYLGGKFGFYEFAHG